MTDPLKEIESQAAALRAGPRQGLRERVLAIGRLIVTVRRLGTHVLGDATYRRASARVRILEYFRRHVGVCIQSIELEVVGGISQYARRIRELRVEHGYRIISGASPDEFTAEQLSASEYILLDAEPDKDAAQRWKTASGIRKSKRGSKAKILEYLKANVGQVVTTDELSYVSGGRKAFGRRARELRTEEGYRIATRFTGRPDLRMGEYVLESLDRLEPHDRSVSPETQRIVYERDRSTCRSCGWNRDRWRSDDPRILELHHVRHHRDRGPNEPENLIVLCSRCHDDIHARRLLVDPVTRQVTRA